MILAAGAFFMKKSDSLRLTLPNDISFFPIALACVREAAKKFGFVGEVLNQIELGLEEAVTNVIDNASDLEEASTFDIVCERTPVGIKIVIKEKGMPFDPSRLPTYNPEGLAEGGPTAGLGVFLMKEVMNEVSFHNLGPEGKETRLVKYLPGKNIEAYLSPQEIEPMAIQTETPPV